MKPRLTILEQVCWQSDGQPLSFGEPYQTLLDSDEQPYVRLQKIGPDWVPLDLGWVESPAMVLISNETGRGEKRNVTEAEKAQRFSLVVEARFGDKGEEDFEIPPKESARLSPIKKLWLRCREGEAKVKVVAFQE